MQKADYSIWAEQDEKTSRLVIKIGDDRPFTLLSYDRSMPAAFASITGLQITDTRSATEASDPNVKGSFVAMQVNLHEPSQ